MRLSTWRALRALFVLLAFGLAAAGAILVLRLDRPHVGISLLRGATAFIAGAIVVSVALTKKGRPRRPFDPRAGRSGSDD